MGQRHLRILCMTLIAAATATCGTGAPSQMPSLVPSQAPSPVPSPTPVPAATSFAEYAVGFCAAWEALFLAVGNPDTGSGSVLSKALDDAVAAKDGTAAEELAAEITSELESGRHAVAYAGGWPPAAPMMAQLDRVFVGFEVMTAAHVPVAKGEPDAADPQAALERSGAIEAWTAMLEAYRALGALRPAGVQRCGDLPISP
jgi:hypothetical protein